MRISLLILAFITIQPCFSQTDSLSILRRLDDIEFKLNRYEGNEQNYKLEKDLLKETYSNNYERINLIITIVLGVIGILGYLGLKDVNSLKKEYEKELSNLRNIQGEFKIKSDELEKDKKKLDEELKNIIKENEEQSRRIKFIELKEKIGSLLKDNNLTSALEFSNAALELSKNDIDVLNYKGRILCRLNQLKDALDSFQIALSTNPNDNSTILNITECMYFANEIASAKKIIEEHKNIFESKENEKVLELFELFELYHNNDKEKLLEIAKNLVDHTNLKSFETKFSGWDLREAQYIAHFQKDSELKTILQNIINHWSGQIDGQTLLKRLNLEIPKAPTETK